MSLLVVGCNHRSASLPLLERLAVPAEELPKALKSLTALDHVQEAVVLSTCNRVEIYASVTRFHPGLQELRGWLAERGDIHPQDLDELQYSYHDDRAAAHLFAVAGGIDSMVVGERQIAMQVKQAMETAREEGTARRVLQRLFRQAVRVGRRVRSDTAISRGASSMVDVGLDVAAQRLGAPLAGRRVLLVGAGKMGGLTARRLADESAGQVDVWNRSEDKARRLALRTGGQVVAPTGLATALATADLVVCTTGAPEPVLDLDLVLAAVQERRAGHDAADGAARPLVLLDLAMPRNVDPACHDVPGVEVVDIADVREVADRGVTGEVVAAARRIVDEEAERFLAWTRASEVEPTIRDLRRTAEQVRAAELDRLSGKLSSLDDRQREAVEALTRGIVNTLLHAPTVRLKELADRTGAEAHADALRDLFGLDEPDADA
ncbi:glutamyl-tRNA reductase [Egicoccus sp. AB-alg2]|uniref:glutamyl-tRNA reductase n=1 Tax=Egicoccus sp. AB-alg2 TaxID=3242693 RepID=UPI00359E6FB1